MEFIRKLPIPRDIKEEYPIFPEKQAIRKQVDQEMKDIISGKSDKFLLIIGPCSADNVESVLEYMSRLSKIQQKVKDKILIVPRVYTNKPRTTGQGYKGMLHQPNPMESEDMLRGIIAIRNLHRDILTQFNFSCADEMLYPENYRYISDLLGYTAIGARSVENQQHRLTSSGIDVPVGMKNPTEGGFKIMMNSIKAAQSPHTFIYRGWEVKTTGNPYAHAILRGFTDSHGNNRPNYHYEDIMKVNQLYKEYNLQNPAVIIDTSHANANKDHTQQVRIAKDVLHSRKQNQEIKTLVKGLMIESYLIDGTHNIEKEEYCYGKSITDPCIGWETTEKLILDIANDL